MAFSTGRACPIPMMDMDAAIKRNKRCLVIELILILDAKVRFLLQSRLIFLPPVFQEGRIA
jgi:hypothetical protein